MADTYEIVAGFAEHLRRFGIAVDPSSCSSFIEALSLVGSDSRVKVFNIARTTLVKRAEDYPAFSAAFSSYFDRVEEEFETSDEALESETLFFDLGDDDSSKDDDDGGEQEEGQTLRFSAREVLTEKDFAKLTKGELNEIYSLMARMRISGSLQRSRRMKISKRRGSIDSRASLREAIKTDGETIKRIYRSKSEKYRRLIFLLDISGSMDSYSRALLRFLHASIVARGRIEVFTFATRITRITKELSWRDPDRAISDVASRVVDFSGGTRLGDVLADFNQNYGVAGMARGATVVILSDGWDRGDPSTLDVEMTRLARAADRIIWVNPLKVQDGYAPLARGMATCLPHIDDFVEGHSMSALLYLVECINK
ncbi:MAG: VWA domain-containing protein [Actinomycetota bacterium]|nr:VWA domain-containing protein [Actinomycetota bacterium]